MVVGGHEHVQGEVFPQKTKVEMDKELSEIREKMETLALNMQQEEKVHCRYEWHLKRISKWYVRKFLVGRRQEVLKRWLIYVQKPNGKGKKSRRSLIGCQVGNVKRPVDLVNYQEGRGDMSNCHVGKREEMGSDESSLHQGVLTDGEE
jgi:hypothetical protein